MEVSHPEPGILWPQNSKISRERMRTTDFSCQLHGTSFNWRQQPSQLTRSDPREKPTEESIESIVREDSNTRNGHTYTHKSINYQTTLNQARQWQEWSRPVLGGTAQGTSTSQQMFQNGKNEVKPYQASPCTIAGRFSIGHRKVSTTQSIPKTVGTQNIIIKQWI